MDKKIKKFINENKGFTFIEMLMVTVIMSIIIVPLTSMMSTTYSSFFKSTHKFELLNEHKKILSIIEEDLQYNTDVQIQPSLTEMKFIQQDTSEIIYKFENNTLSRNSSGNNVALCDKVYNIKFNMNEANNRKYLNITGEIKDKVSQVDINISLPILKKLWNYENDVYS